MPGFVDINGSVFPEEEAKISAFDRGFLLGDGCFEVLKVAEGQFCFIEEHLDRLFWGLSKLHISLGVSREVLKERMISLLKYAGFSEAYFRLTVTRGSSLGFFLPKNLSPNLYLFIRELSSSHKAEPLKLKLIQGDSAYCGPQPKTNRYQETLGELLTAQEEGYDDILLVNARGEITEASASNIFFIQDSSSSDGGVFRTLFTPCLETGILAGVTRARVIKKALELGVKTCEKKLRPQNLKEFSGCFLTSSIKGMVSVCNINDVSFSSKKTRNFFSQFKTLFVR